MIVPIDMSLFSLRGVVKLVDIILYLKNNLAHDIQIRALVTMFDYRTRYARQVLKKVKEEFGENVFTSVIRYNVRLRETVDYGLPVGDYDRHAIGHKDYEQLAREVLQLKPNVNHHSRTTLSGAEYVVKKAEDYINSAGDSADIDSVIAELEDFIAETPSSSYTDMIDKIAQSDENFWEDDDLL